MAKKLSLEESLIESGLMDERDIDYLNHLQIPEVEISDEIAMEGIINAIGNAVGTIPGDMYTDIKGWFLSIESKRRYIDELCQDIITWLKDKESNNKKLNLDMNSFKTWLKTSESFIWRYYFLLNDSTWNRIHSELINGDITSLETLYSVDFSERHNIATILDSITTVGGLIKKVEIYQQRSNEFFKLIFKRKLKVKKIPFQIILLGASDLRRTVKKIVYLAL